MDKKPTGFADFIRILAHMKGKGPVTTAHIAETFGWQYQSARVKLGQLREAGIIGIKLTVPAPTNPAARIILWGMGEDDPTYADKYGIRHPHDRGRKFGVLWAELKEGKRTVDELASAADMFKDAVRFLLSMAQQKEFKMVRISGWDREHRHMNWVAQYSLGTGKDAPRPAPMSIKEKSQKARDRRKLVTDVTARVPVSVFDLARTTVSHSASV